MARRKARPAKQSAVAAAVQTVTGGQALQVKNRYDAAGTGRRMRGWNPPNSGPNVAIVGLENIRKRSRDAGRNDWAGAAATQRWVTNLIGVGITPRLPTTLTKKRRKEITDLWDRWVAESDADGVLDFYGQQTLAVRCWLDSGEVFVRQRKRRVEDGIEVPVQIQLIEPEFVPMLDADTYPFLPVGNKIRSGIEFDRRGQRIAYWMHREHPGDGHQNMGNASLLRVLASEVSHVFEPLRPGQLRGVPGLAPVLARLRNVADFDDTVLERQKLANLFVAFLTRNAGSDLDQLTGGAVEFDGAQPLAPMQPGLMQELGLGEDVKFSNPPEAGVSFSDYMRTQHLGTAAGAGLPYEIMSGDIKEVSDRTLRVMINEFRRFAESRQWQIVIPMFCKRVRKWWAETALLAGHITADELNDVMLVKWSPHGWAHIHPVQDPTGKKVEVDAGFRSRSSVIGERGDDPEEVDDERAADVQREKDLNLWVDPNPAPAAPGADPTDPEDPEDLKDPAGPQPQPETL
jgi:lambda family phage portal protein